MRPRCVVVLSPNKLMSMSPLYFKVDKTKTAHQVRSMPQAIKPRHPCLPTHALRICEPPQRSQRQLGVPSGTTDAFFARGCSAKKKLPHSSQYCSLKAEQWSVWWQQKHAIRQVRCDSTDALLRTKALSIPSSHCPQNVRDVSQAAEQALMQVLVAVARPGHKMHT